MSEFPWGVFIILSCGLAFTGYCVFYILRLAYLEMQDETSESDSVSDESEH
jgi:hypothetical protein